MHIPQIHFCPPPLKPFLRVQWRRNQGFRRFNEPGTPSSWGPELLRAPSGATQKIRQESNRPGRNAIIALTRATKMSEMIHLHSAHMIFHGRRAWRGHPGTQKASKLLAAGALPQTPLRELTALLQAGGAAPSNPRSQPFGLRALALATTYCWTTAVRALLRHCYSLGWSLDGVSPGKIFDIQYAVCALWCISAMNLRLYIFHIREQICFVSTMGRDTRNMLSKMSFFVGLKSPISSKILSKFLIFVQI